MSTIPLSWTALVVAGVADVVWAITTKYANGYSRLGWSLASLASLGVFIGLLSYALKNLPIGTAYAVWTGIGAAGTVLAGVILFGEAVSVSRLLAIAVIVLAVAALKMSPA